MKANHSTSNNTAKKGKDNPMKITEFEKDMYKDSVNILGMSMDELEDFMNPSQPTSLKSKEDQS